MKKKAGFKFPKYVRVGSTAMEHTPNGRNVYYRVNGAWGVDVRFEGASMFAVHYMSHINDLPIIEITKEEFKADN